MEWQMNLMVRSEKTVVMLGKMTKYREKEGEDEREEKGKNKDDRVCCVTEYR